MPKVRTSYKPGQTGNPGGRPKSKELTEVLKTIVDPQKLAQKLWELAIKRGDLSAIRYIYDRIEGTPLQRTELTIDDVRERARRIAEEQGLDPDVAIEEAEAIFRGAHR